MTHGNRIRGEDRECICRAANFLIYYSYNACPWGRPAGLRFSESEEDPKKPDPGNTGVGNGNKEKGEQSSIPIQERGFLFLRKGEMRLTVNGEAYCT